MLLSISTNYVLELNECSSSPCLNNGTCFSDLNNYRCECPVGFTGQNCEGMFCTECYQAQCRNIVEKRLYEQQTSGALMSDILFIFGDW